MDPNIIPSQIPTRVNKICLREVSCLREGKENTGYCQEGFWPWQKNVDLTKGSEAELYWKWLQKIFDPPPTPPKRGHNIPKKGTISFDFETTLAWYIIVVSRFAQIILFPHPHTRKWKMDATW